MARPLPRTILLLGVVSLLTDVSSEMIFPLLPVFMTVSLGASPTYLGVIEGLADTTAALLKLVSGWLVDKTGRYRPLILGGYTLSGVARGLITLATAPWHVLALRVSDRVGKGIRTSPRDALIARSADPEGSATAFGFHRAMDHAGAVIGPLIATLLLGWGLSIRSIFGLALVPTILALGVLAQVREPPPLPAPAPEVTPRVSLPPQLRGYLGVLLLFSLGNASDAFMLLRAHELGVPEAQIPLLWSLLHVVRLSSSWFGGRLADKFPRVWLITGGWGVFSLAWLAMSVATSPAQVWGIFAFYGLYHGLAEPAQKALIKDLSPVAAQGRAYGWFNLVTGLSALPASLLMGELWSHITPRWAMTAGAGWALTSMVVLTLWQRRWEKHPA